MICPNCGSTNVNVQVLQVSAKTRKKRQGCLYGLGRLCLIICTCGLWLIFGKKNGTEKTTFNNETIGICQNCGKQFKIS